MYIDSPLPYFSLPFCILFIPYKKNFMQASLIFGATPSQQKSKKTSSIFFHYCDFFLPTPILWVEAHSVAKVNERTVRKFVYTHICCRFGTPLEIVSDNGPGFRKGLLTEVCDELHILHRHSTPYYPQSNGLVEKANGVIAGIIRKMVKNKTKLWDDFLDGALWAYRTTYREATEFTPFHLVYGQEALQPIELNIPTMRLHGKSAQDDQEAWMDRLLTLAELEWKREAAYECYKRKATQTKEKL
ncbi:hypothetical protein DD596_25545, partial [Enterobacter cloacae complex sp. 4DZ3-28B]